jgi:membrane fusion protein, multidrug efflux system
MAEAGPAPRWPRPPRRGRRALALVAAAAVLVAGGVYGVQLWQWWARHVSTDDAFVQARVAAVSAQIRGTVVRVEVEDNQAVEPGQLLVQLDPRDWEVRLAQSRAAVTLAQSRLEAAAAGVPLADEATRSQVAQAEAAAASARLGVDMAQRGLEERASHLRVRRAAIEAARADVEVRQADFERVRLDRERLAELARRDLVARQEVDHAEAAFRSGRASLEAARQRLGMAVAEAARADAEVASQEVALAQARRRIEEAEAAVAAAQSRRREVDIRRAEAASAEAQLAEALANIRDAELGLEYTTVVAPLGGRVTRKTVEVGQVVQPGQPLLAVVSLEDVWVVANYKETQLTHVRPGQPATVRVDAYPGLVLRARVDSIQSGTGSRFSLLPAQNASGNFVKVVQRIPVKLVLEPGDDGGRLLVPGMSVVPTIQVR